MGFAVKLHVKNLLSSHAKQNASEIDCIAPTLEPVFYDTGNMMLSPSLFFAVALLVVATLTVDSAVQPGYHGETEYAREKRQTADESE